MKKAVIFFLILISLTVGLLAWKSRSQENIPMGGEKKPVKVKTQTAGDSRKADFLLSFPGLVKSEQEVVAKAKAGGQVIWLNFEVGDGVSTGEILAKIDDQGNLTKGENNFSSNQIQQQELVLKQAKKTYSSAKEDFRKDDSEANELAKKIAKLQYQGAQTALQSLLNNALLSAPASGVVTEKEVSVGDTVSSGQALAVISQGGAGKIQFFVEREMLEFVKKGDLVKVKIGGDDVEKEAKVSLIALEADVATKKFKIEADFSEKEGFSWGTIVTVKVAIQKKTTSPNNFLLPISVLTIGQNESFLFVSEEGRAKKVLVKIQEVAGEIVEITADLKEDAKIIIEGNKQVQDGSAIVDNN